MRIYEDYQWLDEMLRQEFGENSVMPIIYNNGGSLMFQFTWGSRVGYVLAQKRFGPMDSGEYAVLEEETGFGSMIPCEGNYSLNDQPDPRAEIIDMINITRAKWGKGGTNGEILH